MLNGCRVLHGMTFMRTGMAEKFFDWFCKEAGKVADVVLVDSRTGVTEMSGVCTYHLADVVLMFVTPNFQNLSGTLMLSRNLKNKRFISEGRKGRPLSLLFVPSRVESAEGEKLDEFGERFIETLGDSRFLASFSLTTEHLSISKIPYVPYYAYVEDVAVRNPRQAKAADICRAFERLSETLADMQPPESKLRRVYHPESLQDESNLVAEQAFARLSIRIKAK